MILKDLIQECKWNNVRYELLEEYSDVFDIIKSFEQVYSQLKKLEPKQNRIKIKIQKVNDIYNENKGFVAVSGIMKGQELGSTYNISAINWQDWLGMEIENETINKFSFNQIVSYCLYEMTFFGFDQEKIKNKLKEFK